MTSSMAIGELQGCSSMARGGRQCTAAPTGGRGSGGLGGWARARGGRRRVALPVVESTGTRDGWAWELEAEAESELRLNCRASVRYLAGQGCRGDPEGEGRRMASSRGPGNGYL
jgi:hypothetical protein